MHKSLQTAECSVLDVVQQNLEEVSVLKARIKFKKYGALRFIGHLDVMRFFQKAIRRAHIPIAYTEGYSPHMIMSFANPLGIGITSEGEYFDIELKESISSQEAVARLNEVMVEGMEVLSFRQIAEEKKMTGMAIVAAADYLLDITSKTLPQNWESQIEAFLSQSEIRILKQTKRSEKEVDIKPLIYRMEMQDHKLFMQLAAGSVENLKPGLVMEAFCQFLGADASQLKFTLCRLELYADLGDENTHNLVSLESLGTVIE